MIEQAANSADAIHLAAQVGRLDIVSLILGLLALLLGVGALLGFWLIRSAAMSIAKDEAATTAKKVAEAEAVPEARRAAIEFLESQGIDWSTLRSSSAGPGGNNQSLADAMDNGGEGR